MEVIVFDEAQKIWHKIAKTTQDNKLRIELELHKKLLNIFQVGDYYYYIFNCATTEMEFVHENIRQVLGYEPEEFNAQLFFEIIHPEDLPYFMNFENTVTEFFNRLTPDKILKYKVRYDYRIKKADGTYTRILQQVVAIQSNDNGGVIRVLGVHTDISHLKKENGSVLSFIGLEGEPSYIDVDVKQVFVAFKEVLSRREKEILAHIAGGYKTKQIAEELNISKQTVSTHRKNMLIKTNTKTTLELVMKAIKEGWI